MVDQKNAEESNTIVREPKPGGSQVDKSRGKGDDAINQTHESGKETGSVKGDQPTGERRPTQDPPDDGGFRDDNPNERG